MYLIVKEEMFVFPVFHAAEDGYAVIGSCLCGSKIEQLSHLRVYPDMVVIVSIRWQKDDIGREPKLTTNAKQKDVVVPFP